MLTPAASRTTHRAVSSFPALAGASAAPVRSLPLVIRQRRHSSSKQSSTPKQTPAPLASSSSAKENSTGQGKKKSAKSRALKENAETKQAAEALQTSNVQPPSVPSTAHVDPKSINLATLFAQHRPISLMQPLPPHDNQKSFDAIFAPRSSKQKTQDVIYTLATAVKQLESAANGQAGMDMAGQPSLNLEELAKTFRPFHAPPAPVPMDPKYAEKRVITPAVSFGTQEPPMPEGAAAEILDKSTGSRIASSLFRERMKARQATWLSKWLQQVRVQWSLLSVKRLRRLKMKKHKFKKLMKKTRNIRKRQDRL